MRKERDIIILIALMAGVAMGTGAQAQQITDNAVFYHSIRSPWSNSLNPALFPSESGWYMTTAKTSVQLALPMSYEDFGLRYDPERGVSVLDLNHVLDQLRVNGCHFDHNTDVNLLGFGFTIGDKLHLTASAGVKYLTSFTVPLGFIDLLTEGNLNEPYHIDFGASDIFNGQMYGYASVGAAFRLPLFPLTIGARVNVLDGLTAVSVDNLSLDLTTSEDVSMLRLSSNYLVHTAGVTKVSFDREGGFSFDYEDILKYFPQNFGFTFDIGAKLKVNIFDLSLSIVDIGPGVHWVQNPLTIVPKEKDVTITFDGIDLSTLLTNGVVDTSFISRFKDSALAMIDYVTEENDYWYTVPTRMYLGASVSLGKLVRAGYLFQGQWINGWFNNHRSGSNHFACNNTLSAHVNLFNWMELSAANSFTYDGNKVSWLNPGFAVTVSPGRKLQVFAAIEYLSSMRLVEVKAAHVMFGINMVGMKE
ncbi:MAG: hypothetical protein J5641_03825 [Bacteroidales bacterium]|nr:hypothetical protein [Bacteroidales bacterium]